MKEKFKGFADKLKTFWKGLSKVVRTIIIVALVVIIAGSIGITVYLNRSSGSDYIVLFPGMSSEEATDVYLELQNKNVETKINSDGEIEVKRSEWDTLVYELAELGYPQTAPSYGTFFDNLGMTMTEFEKKQTLRFQLQDRLQTTLKRIEGVKGAVVTINIPETSKYAIKDNPDEKATASVTLTLSNSAGFTPENVSAVKKLVAFSAQQMEPEDVIVIDSSTGNELLSVEDGGNSGGGTSTEEKMEYASIIKNQYEEAAKRILMNMYPEGVDAVAAVELDYDKITEERKQLLTDENGNGVLTDEHVMYRTDEGTIDEGGITGEENNSDIPNYQNDAEDDLDSDNTPYYERDREWDTGYQLTQTVRDIGAIKNAYISVVVTTENAYLSRDQQNNVRELIRTATGIPAENISVLARQTSDTPIVDPNPEPKPYFSTRNIIILLVLSGLVLLLIILLIIFIMSRRMKKKIKKHKEESDAVINELQELIEENNSKSLSEAADEHTRREKSTEMEVREFAKNNPEITAALIRSLLKERE